MKNESKTTPKNKQFLFYLKSTGSDAGDLGEHPERCLETSKLRKTSKNSTLFIPVNHCGTPYSKSVIPCRRPSTVGDE